jgi:uncharacterized membrane protein SpoIIM required for sporulation
MLLPRLESSIQPGREGPVLPAGGLASLSAFYFTHNTQVCLVVFALGLTWGVGTALVLWETGLELGALGAVFLEAGDLRGFATGLLPHGVLELPAVFIAGGAGFVLAQAMYRARPWSRLDELASAGRLALWLVVGCVPLLAAAGVLEAGVARAPDWFLESGLKLAVASLFALLFVSYLVFLGWGRTGRALARSGDAAAPLAAFRRERLAADAPRG